MSRERFQDYDHPALDTQQTAMGSAAQRRIHDTVRRGTAGLDRQQSAMGVSAQSVIAGGVVSGVSAIAGRYA